MLRTVAMTLLIAAGAGAVAAESDQPKASDEPGSSNQPGASDSSLSQERAVTLARQTLADQLKVAADDLAVEAVEARTWNDSSMGCGKPGAVALTVITEGYAVTLAAPDRQYRVHVSGANAIVCNRPVLTRKTLSRPVHARGLDVMIEKARQDLAQRLGIDPASIKLHATQPHRWADNGLDCPRAGEAIVAKPVDGFRLSFKAQSRIYNYHSDLEDVRACPAIESQ